MREHNIEKITEETLQGFEGVKRAEPKPFLLTRIMASINKQSSEKNKWIKAGAFISRPSVAIAGIAFIFFINMSIIFLNRNNEKNQVVQNSTTIVDEFAVSAANIYDIENQEAQ